MEVQSVNESIASSVENRLNILPPDEELVTKINFWVQESKSFYDELIEVQKISEKYYLGNQTRKEQIPGHLSNLVMNRIFENTESLLPIVTSNPSEFVCKSPDNSELGLARSVKMQKVLANKYDETAVSKKIEEAVRQMTLFRFGVLKAFWDEETDDIGLKSVRPQRILIPKYARYAADLPYVIEKIDMTYQEILDFFGKETADILITSGTQTDADDTLGLLKQVWTIQEVWTDYWRVYKYQNRILKKETNPYYDFNDLKKNYLDKPRKPYFVLAAFGLGKTPISETSLTEQAIPIQDAINAVGRIIINHASKTGNSPWRIDSSVMSKEEADSIRNEPGLIIYGSGVANDNMVRRDAPPSMPNYIFLLWQYLNKSLDNLYGLHSTTRGEREGRETARGRLMLKQADYGRLDYIVREVDRVVSEVGQFYAQLMRMFYTDKRTIKYLGRLNETELLDFSSEDVEDGMWIMVRSGSTLPKDEVSEAQNAIQLWQMGAIDPISLYEKLGDPNPQERAERLMKWKTGTLIPAPVPAGAPIVGAGAGAPVVEPTVLPPTG